MVSAVVPAVMTRSPVIALVVTPPGHVTVCVPERAQVPTNAVAPLAPPSSLLPLVDGPPDPLVLLPDPLPEPPPPPEHATRAAAVKDAKSSLMKRRTMFSTPSVARMEARSYHGASPKRAQRGSASANRHAPKREWALWR